MSGLPVIIAALPREIAGLVRGITPDPAWVKDGIFLYALPDALVVCAGMGGLRATLAVKAALAFAPATMLVSTGLAGGCDPAVAVGAVMAASTVIDTLSGARFVCDGVESGATLATTHTIASVQEKARLHAAYGAAMVDMEAATVARLASVHGLPFRAIKAVSDAHDFELSSLARFASPHGHFRTRAFALHTALRPRTWRTTMKLGRGSQRALHALTGALKQL